jgi:hypothetical protein
MDARILCFIILASLIGCASAAPFTASVKVNGVDPTADVTTVTPGAKANVQVSVDVESEGIIVEDIRFSSSPAAMGQLLNDFVGDEARLPRRLKDIVHTESYDLPGVMPAGQYNLAAKVTYTGSQSGVVEYNGRIRVESTGFVSTLLGLVVKVLPGAISKPLMDFFI